MSNASENLIGKPERFRNPTFLEKGRDATSKLGLVWPIVLVPIWQEVLFRYLPYTFLYLPYGRFWEIGIATNLVFASIHWYLGKWFIFWAFFWGAVAWWVMGESGVLGAILLHSLVNIADLRFGIRKYLQNYHSRLEF